MRTQSAFRRGVITLVGILSCTNPACAQDESSLAVPLVSLSEASPIRPTSSYREGLIHLDVSIADRRGKAIAGLDLTDLTLLDNGKPAKLLTLRPDYPADVNASLTEVALVLDDLDSSGLLMAQARSELINYLRQNNGRLAQPTSVYRLNGAGFYASPRPTKNGADLAKDVERNHFPRVVWQRTGPSVPGGEIGTMTNFRKALRSLYALAVNWSEEPGRKALIWIGPGWSANGYISSKEDPFPLLVELLSRIREARMVLYQASPAETRDRDFAYEAYAAGVRSSAELSAHMQYFALQVLALESGGLVLDEGFSFASDIEQCVRDAGSFYTLSFDPPHAAQVDEYHDLKIEVKTPGAVVRTNSGYYDQPVFYDQPRIPAQQVTVQQLESILERDEKQRDGDLPERLNAMELTERMSSSKLASWLKRLPGKEQAALTVLANASVFYDPPAAEIPANPAPDHDAQVQIVRRTVQYLNMILPRLPDFYAIRTLVEYDQLVRDQSPWKTAPADQSLHEWVTEKSTMLYRNGREEQVIHKRKARKNVKKDLTFIGIFGPILHRVLNDATTGGNGLTWSRWQRGEHGDEAVFRYSVHSDHPRYEVVSCCLRNGDTFRTDPEYHGELAIDPQTGVILRITIQSEPGWIVEPNLTPVRFVRATGMMLEYGPVQIGGKTFICPQRSVVTMRTRFVQPLKVWDQDATVYGAYENMMDDIAFTDYHKFGSESRILPDFDVVQDEKPVGGKSQPSAQPQAHH